MPDAILQTSRLTKVFDGLKAVEELDLRIRRGEIYGFLGPNGAGKTTTIKMVLGLVTPTAGGVWFDGRSLGDDPHGIKRMIGYLPERLAFYPNLTARQTLRFFCDLKGIGYDDVDPLLARVGLEGFRDARVKTFSKGMVQLLGVAQSLLGEPQLLIWDEPTAGLDPRWARLVKDMILETNRRRATVLFSSHILGEVQEVAHRVGILDQGRLIAEDTVDRLRSQLNIRPRLRLSVATDLPAAADAARAVPGVEAVRIGEGILELTCNPDVRARVIASLESSGHRILDLRTEEPSLEDVFLSFTEKTAGRVR